MNSAQRIIVNSLAQQIRSVLNVCLSLYSTRIVLEALGQNDYGIYSLIGGVVAMLSFLTNAMVVTTQRQLSFYHGKGLWKEVHCMFSNSLFLHFVIGVTLAVVLSTASPFFFNGFLNIDASRTETAKIVYLLVVVSLFVTFLTAPFRAVFIARENIVYISIIDVVDGVIKLIAAIWLLHCPFDRLIAYACIVVGITTFNFAALASWAQINFEESTLFPRRKDINRQSLRELTGFAGWTVYSQLCVIGRTQGVAIVLNRFYGTIINAAYGIAQHVFGSIQFIAVSVTNAMAPQIMKAEGSGDRKRMLHLSELLSKYAVLLLSTVTIPLVFEMPAVLKLWLGNVPDNTVLLCRFILLTALCDQITIGLGTANQAIGRIRNYSIIVNTIKVLTLPAFWICLYLGYSLIIAMYIYLCFELLCAMIRLPFLKYTAGLSIHHFFNHVFAKVAVPLMAISAASWIVTSYVQVPFRFLITGTVALVAAIVSAWFFSMEYVERKTMKKMVKKIQKMYLCFIGW